jgi:hypothetical protein
MIIHMGVRTALFHRPLTQRRCDTLQGVYGDKTATLERFRENYKSRLSDGIKARLVLENDEVIIKDCIYQGGHLIDFLIDLLQLGRPSPSLRGTRYPHRGMSRPPAVMLCFLSNPIQVDYHHDWINVRSPPSAVVQCLTCCACSPPRSPSPPYCRASTPSGPRKVSSRSSTSPSPVQARSPSWRDARTPTDARRSPLVCPTTWT